MRPTTTQFKMILPLDLKRWIEVQAAQNMRSQSAEIIYLLRERMQAQAAAGRAA